MSIAKAIEILNDVRERMEEITEIDAPLQELDSQFADDAEARDAAPELWAQNKLDEAIKLLTPHLGY